MKKYFSPPRTLYGIGLQDFHYKNIDDFLGRPIDDIKGNKPPRAACSSTHTVIEEYLCQQPLVTAPKDPRWITLE